MRITTDERRVEEIAELEKERDWHVAEIEGLERALNNHRQNIRSIEAELEVFKASGVEARSVRRKYVA